MPYSLDSHKTALVLIDLQHGVVGMPVKPLSSAVVVDASRNLAQRFREKSAMVVYVRADLANMLPLKVDLSHSNPDSEPPPAIASELVPEAGFEEGDVLITKRHWGAFGVSTGLAQILNARGIDTIVLAGIATNFGVESTAREASSLGLNVVIAKDACTSLDATAHAFAMEQIFPLIARVNSADEIARALS